jgi:hypothetical protein
MHPPLPRLTAPVRAPQFRMARIHTRATWIASLLMCCTLGTPATAGTENEVANSQEPGQYRTSPVAPALQQHPTRLLQTRYTVRKKIESIEPISWLEHYGEVHVREIQH